VRDADEHSPHIGKSMERRIQPRHRAIRSHAPGETPPGPVHEVRAGREQQTATVGVIRGYLTMVLSIAGLVLESLRASHLMR
jgi:hypothetical protein